MFFFFRTFTCLQRCSQIFGEFPREKEEAKKNCHMVTPWTSQNYNMNTIQQVRTNVCSHIISTPSIWVFLGIRTCDIVLCCRVIVFLLYIVSRFFVVFLVLWFTSLVSFTGSYAEDEPLFCLQLLLIHQGCQDFLLDRLDPGKNNTQLTTTMATALFISLSFGFSASCKFTGEPQNKKIKIKR